MPSSKVPPQHSGDLPVGTVIDWYRQNVGMIIPDGWQFCDGGAITDTRSPLVGTNTLDLRNTFIRGKNDITFGSTSGGANTHSHGPGTLQFYTMYEDGSNNIQFYNSGGALITKIVIASINEGAGSPLGRLARTGSSPAQFYTSNGAGSSDTASTLPAYVGLIKLMKIF